MTLYRILGGIKMRPVSNFPDYFVDKEGNIWSTKRLEPIKLKPGVGTRGYLQVGLYQNKKGPYVKFIHRLVLEAFVGPCPKGYWARHLDGIKVHNELSNLKWDTPSNNCKDRKKHSTQVYAQGEKHGKSILTEPDVIEIRRLLKSGEITQGELGKMFNVDKGTISQINTRRNWRYLR